MTLRSISKLVPFLQNELSLSASAVPLALKLQEKDPGSLPMILWQYSLITLVQADQRFMSGLNKLKWEGSAKHTSIAIGKPSQTIHWREFGESTRITRLTCAIDCVSAGKVLTVWRDCNQ